MSHRPRAAAVVAATVLAFLVTPACSSGPELVKSDEIEAEFAAKKQKSEEFQQRQKQYERVLIDLDKAIDEYVTAWHNSSHRNAEQTRTSIDGFIRQNVSRHYDRLLLTAYNENDPRNRAIALAALGFSDTRDALDVLLTGTRDENWEVVSNAIFGLSQLNDARTPVEPFARVMNEPGYNEMMRAGAAWALYRVQTNALQDARPAVDVWLKTLERPIDDIEPGVLVSAIRGLGATRDAGHAATIERFVSHNTPKVRETTAIALGRLGARRSYPSLLTLIGLAEENANVRLAARKALQALAGQQDRQYDVEAWRKLFEDGREPNRGS